MEQKDYKLEILKMLMKKESHGRELAKLVGTNHMTALRKLGELRDMNVIDLREEGKNKVYFVKRSEEARNYLIILEQYKLMRLLFEKPELRGIIRNIQEDKRIELAILFGSYAKGIAKKDSDIDIFVESSDRKIRKELESFNSKLSVKIGAFDKDNSLIREIIEYHVIIKGVEKYYEKIGFFEQG